MAFGESARQNTISIGDGSSVVHHTVKSEILNRCPTGSPLASLVKHYNKGARSNQGMRWSPSVDVKSRDGHSFAYILHYLSTGDLIYPLHEGFHRVDVLLKELTFFGLVEDVIRYATQEGSGRSKQSKRRSILFTTRDNTEPDRKVDNVPLAKYQSIQNVHFINDRAAGAETAQSASMSDLSVERSAELEIRDQNGDPKLSTRQQQNVHGHRFLNAIKRYLSLKPSIASNRCPSNKRTSTVADDAKAAAAVWSPRSNSVGGGGGGVFRPNSARGSTLVLIAAPDTVTIFGQRTQLEAMFPEYPIEALRSFSSAFIDSKLIYQPDDTSSGGGDIDAYSSSSFNSGSSLPKRGSSSVSSDGSSGGSGGNSELLYRLFQRHIQPLGFTVTVQSHWRNIDSLETHHQWLLHKKHNSKHLGNSTGRRRFSHAGMMAAVSTTTLNNPVARRASVLQRIFNKSAINLHTDV